MTFACQVCTADRLEPIDPYSALGRVTSDCKPWPAGGKLAVCLDCGAAQALPDAAWFDDIDRIYKGYQIYELSGGSEQVVFAGGSTHAAPRSRLLVDFLRGAATLGESGKLIDIGCGNGGALRTFSQALPGWQLYGTELTDAALPLLQKLPNFVRLYTGADPDIAGRFELVSMIHALEHMSDPGKTLRRALALLADDGLLFIQVPDAEASPFDLIVADHLMHFSRATLRYLAERCGFRLVTLRNDVVPKENTLLARRGAASVRLPDAAAGMALTKHSVEWLHAVVELATATANAHASFGLFGTSIAGMWLYGVLRDKTAFFVDEDKTRIGRQIDGRPIIAPADAPRDAVVFVPLLPAVAENVITRLSSPAQFIAPPPLNGAAIAA